MDSAALARKMKRRSGLVPALGEKIFFCRKPEVMPGLGDPSLCASSVLVLLVLGLNVLCGSNFFLVSGCVLLSRLFLGFCPVFLCIFLFCFVSLW